jgi:hypothetical protein
MRIGVYIAGLCVVLATAPLRSAQALPEWRVTQPLTGVDRTRILALAEKLSIDRPAIVTSEVIGTNPVACEALRIESVHPVINARDLGRCFRLCSRYVFGRRAWCCS